MKSILTFLSLMFAVVVNGQCDSIIKDCTKHISKEYISDGQVYRTLLMEDQIAEFTSTFYGGNTYRIAACSGLQDGNLIFSIYDQERNLLFNNVDHQNSPYWDFTIDQTLDCTIEAQLDIDKIQSGCGIILIGFRP